MHSYFTIALLTIAPTATWENNYTQAQAQATTQRKPLAVVLGPGSNGWTKVVRADGPCPKVNKLLADHYVCVYLDTNTPDGKKWAQAFQINGGVGMVISDRNGSTQAFWHQGDMTNDNMLHYLTRFSDNNLVVNQTETIPSPAYQPAARPVNC